MLGFLMYVKKTFGRKILMGLKDGNILIPQCFMGSKEEYQDANIIIVGVPMDCTCSFRTGTRFGPAKVREVSYGIEEFSFYQEKTLLDSSYFDCGDLDLPIGIVDRSLKVIKAAANEIFNDEKKPIFVGGEHLISTPVIHEAFQKYGDDLCIMHFDAHADLRDDYVGNINSHATAIKRVADKIPAKNIYQFGIRSGTKEEMEFARKNTNFYPFEVYEPLKRELKKISGRPVYITLDIDVVDPAFANGTGTPEPGGISTKELLDSLLLFKNINIVGFDIVEISPPYDHSDRTAVLGAKIIREMILMMGI
jgi:agmatinase